MKNKIEILPLADYFVVAVKDKDTSELKESFTLNESGADMLRLFCLDKDVNEVAREVAAVYEAPIDLVKKDVEKFAGRMKIKGIL